MTANYYFAIVGHADNPLFEIEFNHSGKDSKVCYFARLCLVILLTSSTLGHVIENLSLIYGEYHFPT